MHTPPQWDGFSPGHRAQLAGFDAPPAPPRALCAMTAHTITMPKTKQQGLANFVQMIINDLESKNYREALLKAVDLWNDVQGEHPIYQVKEA
jgi:hypothetical protein